MVLGFILIGWIGGGVASALYVGLHDGSMLGGFALFALAGSATILLTAACAAVPAPRALALRVQHGSNGHLPDAALGHAPTAWQDAAEHPR